jgi:hypothetical protein
VSSKYVVHKNKRGIGGRRLSERCDVPFFPVIIYCFFYQKPLIMKVIQQNADNWFQREAHVITGHSFLMDDCSCLPVVPENQEEDETPVGFLVTHGRDVSYVAAHTPDGEQIMSAWSKVHSLERTKGPQPMPAEYWYG